MEPQEVHHYTHAEPSPDKTTVKRRTDKEGKAQYDIDLEVHRASGESDNEFNARVARQMAGLEVELADAPAAPVDLDAVPF